MSTIIKTIEEILEGVGIGDAFVTDGNGGWHVLESKGPGMVEVELYPGEELDLGKVREALAEIFYPMPQPWRLKDDGMPGVYGLDDEDELIDTLGSRPGVHTLAVLTAAEVCHKCEGEDCYLSGDPEEVGLLLLEPAY